MPQKTETIEIHTEFIRLDSFLKLAAAVSSGGQAKAAVQEGEVSVNGEACTQRTKKLREGDIVSFGGDCFTVIRGGTK